MAFHHLTLVLFGLFVPENTVPPGHVQRSQLMRGLAYHLAGAKGAG